MHAGGQAEVLCVRRGLVGWLVGGWVGGLVGWWVGGWVGLVGVGPPIPPVSVTGPPVHPFIRPRVCPSARMRTWAA